MQHAEVSKLLHMLWHSPHEHGVMVGLIWSVLFKSPCGFCGVMWQALPCREGCSGGLCIGGVVFLIAIARRVCRHCKHDGAEVLVVCSAGGSTPHGVSRADQIS